MTIAYDYIIVGAGSAGCVLANRLSANRDCQVLLLEAGGRNRQPSVRVPAGMSEAIGDARLNWQYPVDADPSRADRPDQWAAGRGLGGSSAINGLFYDRGHPSDYDAWAKDGCEGWGWQSLKPYFDLVEREPTTGPRFKKTGISLQPLADPHPLSRVFLDAVAECGSNLVPQGDGGAHGASLVRVTQERGHRCSAADGYLRPVAQRKNLHIQRGVRVRRLCFEGDRCTGVEHDGSPTPLRVAAGGEVLLCAGAIASPKLLMLSGVGPAAQLAEHAIDSVADLPGVGENLQEHPLAMLGVRVTQRTYNMDARSPWRKAAFLWEWLRRGSGPATSPFSQAAAFFPQAGSDDSRPALEVLFAPHYFEWSADGPRPYAEPAVLGIVSLCRPQSRGSVALRSADPAAQPLIQHAMLGAEADVSGLLEGCHLLRDVFATSVFSEHVREELLPGAQVRSDEQWIDYLRRSVVGGNHLVGTCRMGEGDMSVVDTRLRVRGLQGLRVVDASVMPSLPSTHTNATVLAMAEKAADDLLAA